MTPVIRPVILCGGSGTRLWPLSRPERPKQLLPIAAAETMLQQTAVRVRDPARFGTPLAVCHERHGATVAEQLAGVDCAAERVLMEPVGRNTAAAAAVAALAAAGDDPSAVLALMPADHVIGDLDAFQAALDSAAAAARAGRIVTLGVRPDRAETGFGYIRRGAPLEGLDGCCAVDAFTEKPNRTTAEQYLADGRYLWNAGLFIFRADVLIEEMERHAPEIVAACRRALEDGTGEGALWHLEAAAFGSAPAQPIDVAVMERTDRGAVVPVEMGWSDVGSWQALHEILANAGDIDGNVVVGDCVVAGTDGSYVRSDGPLVAVIGMSGCAVVATEDAVLVCPLDRAQEVKTLVDRLSERRRKGAAAEGEPIVHPVE
ncbi:MAG: mannose-1-phosphate guanylyltransferase/mannose-6-phosphate isomerase [Azospirillaceae bacterium]